MTYQNSRSPPPFEDPDAPFSNTFVFGALSTFVSTAALFGGSTVAPLRRADSCSFARHGPPPTLATSWGGDPSAFALPDDSENREPKKTPS